MLLHFKGLNTATINCTIRLRAFHLTETSSCCRDTWWAKISAASHAAWSN